jgi:hypothetical protein
MTFRSIKLAAGMSLFAAMVATGVAVPGAAVLAQGQLQAVPRAGVAFTNTVTARAKVDTIDTDTRTIAFTRTDGREINCAVSDSVRNLAEIQDDSNVEITYTEIVTVLNLRQKGPGSKEARRESASPPDAQDNEIGRFTLTVVGVDLPNNKVQVIRGTGGQVRTITATSVAQKDMLGKIKTGDVLIGMTTPLTVTRIDPVK